MIPSTVLRVTITRPGEGDPMTIAPRDAAHDADPGAAHGEGRSDR